MDVGVVEVDTTEPGGKKVRRQLEVDFVVNRVTQRYYNIQSALTAAAPEKRKHETEPLKRIPDSFKKIVVVREDIVSWHDEDGILYVGVKQFLLDETAID